MKSLLTITAAIEAVAGAALAIAPSPLVFLLLGSPLDSPAGLVVARLLGVAILALGTACWLARNDIGSPTAVGLVWAMLLYNIAAVSALGYARLNLGLSGVCLVPGIILHAAMAVWCVACLRIACRTR
jgi:hypothetical protein